MNRAINIFARYLLPKFLICCFILFATSCASIEPIIDVNVDSMVPKDFKQINQYPYSIHLQITNNPIPITLHSVFQVSEEKIFKALSKAVIKSNIFSKVSPKEEADYLLNISILDVTFVNANIAMNILAKWELINSNTNKVLLETLILTRSHNVKGLKMGSEDAFLSNIKEGFKKISELNL